MKKTFILCVIIAVAMAGCAKVKDEPQSGRYQLFLAQYPATTRTGDVKVTRLIRVDTVTGDAWVAEESDMRDREGAGEMARVWTPFAYRIKVNKDGTISK